MVKLIIGHKGSGKTNQMVELANQEVDSIKGSIIFIDSILKHADVSLGDLPVFIERLKKISDKYGLDFIVSISAEKEEMIGVDFSGCEILN